MSLALLCVVWIGVLHFPINTQFVFWFILRCHCSAFAGALRDPSCIPCSNACQSSFPSHTYARDAMCFLAGVDPELCDHTPPLLFFIVGELCWSAATHALYLSLVSLSPRSLTPDPLQHAPGTLHFPFSRVRRARSSRGLPVGPGPSRVPVRTQCRDADCVLCTNRQYVDMIAHSPPSRLSSTCPFLLPPALWLYRKTRCGCCWGEMELAC